MKLTEEMPWYAWLMFGFTLGLAWASIVYKYKGWM